MESIVLRLRHSCKWCNRGIPVRAGPGPTGPAIPFIGIGLVLGLAACGTTAVTHPPSPATTATAASSVTLATDADSGRSFDLHVGDRLTVVLGSTYWMVQPPAAPSILAVAAAPTASPSPGCVPGSGCGTVTAEFTAEGAGTTTVVATRASCGEARLCTGSEGRFGITVTVH